MMAWPLRELGFQRRWALPVVLLLVAGAGVQAMLQSTALLDQRVQRPAVAARRRACAAPGSHCPWTLRGPRAAVRPRGPVAAALLRAVQGAGGNVGGGEDARKPRRGRPRKAQPTAVGGAARPEEPRTPLRKPREVRSDRAMAQWVAAEKKGRIKVVVAASELEFSLAKATVLETTAGDEAVREAFALFDDDGSGAIDPLELEQGMRTLGVDSPEDIEELFSSVDADGSGEIDMEEFRYMLSMQPHEVAHYDDLHRALEDRPPSTSPVTAVTIDLTLSGNDLLMDTLAVMQRAIAAHRSSLELVVIKSRAVHDLAMHLYPANRALPYGSSILYERPLHRPAILCSVGVAEYRQMIPLVVTEGDRVLEIGCHSGRTTQQIHEAAGPRGHVVGVDIGPSIVGKARRNYPHVQFDVADGWDVAKLGALAVGPDDVNAGWDSIFVDIGGLSGPDGFLEAVALLRSLKFAFPSLRALVIKVVFRV